ncbi:Diamine acetyltransferase 2 [Perkinsus chesapeaki]|uniref:Diamine acetyltransferase 2 n=1 Tax=Perkinsus chesapeaki TaxID=330153 RepID=A0A7J6LHD8_PERCH|nr:Diamine acetyltransferase 2 [Perkinsus chesapeaki]
MTPSSLVSACSAASLSICVAAGLLALMKRRDHGVRPIRIEKMLSDGRELIIREGKAADSYEVYKMLEKLVLFQKLPGDLKISSYDLYKDFMAGRYRTAIAEVEGSPVGYALFFPNYSTWDGKSVHLEDIYVDEGLRGQGIGRALLEFVAKMAMYRGYKRMDWSAVDWNVAAHGFYEKMGAKRESEWIPFVLDQNGIASLATSSN